MPPSSASDEIRAAIAHGRSDGRQHAITFEQFVHLALYGQGGFYATGGSAGRRQDFLTSPEVGPLFGAVMARALDAWWHELGEPDVFTVVDAGAGPGTLARSIRASGPECLDALDYVAVEVSAIQRERHPEWVRSVAVMPNAEFTGVVLANELLDNLPFRLFVMDGGWLEAYVVCLADGTFAEVLRPADDVADLHLPLRATHGGRVPVQRTATTWATETLSMIERGRLVLIDYASPSTAALAMRPWREWLRTYRGHQRGQHYLRDPGSQDITSEVALDQLIAAAGEPDAVSSQSQFLQRWGIEELVEQGQRVWAEHAARPTVAAMAMRSRLREAEALCDPAGLGGFMVIEYARRGV